MNETRANEFDRKVCRYHLQKALEISQGDSLLDVGCGKGEITVEFYRRFKRIVGIDTSEENLEVARRTIENSKKQSYYLVEGENFILEETFDTIIMTNVLEHVLNPVSVLVNCHRHLNIGGVLFITVPNAYSFNRIIGKMMHLIKDEHELSSVEIERFGHRRVYDKELLISHVSAAGFKIKEMGGIVFKPFTNGQMQKIIEGESEEWTEKFITSLYEIGKRYPDNCTSLYLVAEK